MARFGDRVDLLTVYIMEAHAQDTWPLGLKQKYNQTHSIAERAAVARDFVRNESYEFTLRIDPPPADAFETAFAAWPLRFYVIENRKISFICEPYGEYIVISDLEKFFDVRFASKSKTIDA